MTWTETITWHLIKTDELPSKGDWYRVLMNDGRTATLYIPGYRAYIDPEVIAWAELPKGVRDAS